jgi:hypothetical protein
LFLGKRGDCPNGLRSALVGNGFDCGGENAAVSGFFSKVERALRVGGGKAFR